MPSGTADTGESTPLPRIALAGAIDPPVRVAVISGADRPALDGVRRQVQLDLLAEGCEVIHLSAHDLPTPNALAARLAVSRGGDAAEALRVYAKGGIRVAFLIDGAENLSNAVAPLLNSWLRSSDIGSKLLFALFGSEAAGPIASLLAEGLAPAALSLRQLPSPAGGPEPPASQPGASPPGAAAVAEPAAFTETLIQAAHDFGPEAAAPTTAGAPGPAPLHGDGVEADRAAEEIDPARPLVWHPDDDTKHGAAPPDPLTSERLARDSERSAPKLSSPRRRRSPVLVPFLSVVIVAAAGSWAAVHYLSKRPADLGNRLAPPTSFGGTPETQAPSAGPTAAAPALIPSGPTSPTDSAPTPDANSAPPSSNPSPEVGDAGAPVRLRPGFTTNPSEQTANTEHVAPGAIPSPPPAVPPVQPPKAAASPVAPAETTPVVPAPTPPASGPGNRSDSGMPAGQGEPQASASPPPQPVSNGAGSSQAAGPGLLVIAKSEDTLRGLYDRVYRGQEAPPPFETVAALNPSDLRAGDVVVFPAPRGGWHREPPNSAK